MSFDKWQRFRLNAVAAGMMALLIGVSCGDDDTGGGDAGADSGDPLTCGNGVVEGLEECDDGEANSDVEPDACRADCTDPRCGDGVIDSEEAIAQPGDSLLDGDRVAGTVTSAAWGHRVGKNLAMAFVAPAYDEPGTGLEALVIGERLPARVVEPCLYDSGNERVRF